MAIQNNKTIVDLWYVNWASPKHISVYKVFGGYFDDVVYSNLCF